METTSVGLSAEPSFEHTVARPSWLRTTRSLRRVSILSECSSSNSFASIRFVCSLRVWLLTQSAVGSDGFVELLKALGSGQESDRSFHQLHERKWPCPTCSPEYGSALQWPVAVRTGSTMLRGPNAKLLANVGSNPAPLNCQALH